jgi:hypothetical protein
VTGDRPAGRDERDREAERRRRLAAAFDDALPESTRDESAEGWGERPSAGGAGDDEWLRSQVPPHHG